jgi:RNA polymerase sigma-70 factor, ECF subfamily
MKPAIAENTLVERFFCGDKESFEVLIEQHETKVFNTAFALTDNVGDAEEVVFEVFSALHQKLESDLGKTAIFDWLIQLTLDTAVKKLINKNREDLKLPEKSAEKSTLEVHVNHFENKHKDLRTALREAAMTLPEPLKFVFLLRDIQGLSISKTAAILGLNVFETRARIHSARLEIRTKLSTLLSEKTGEVLLKVC